MFFLAGDDHVVCLKSDRRRIPWKVHTKITSYVFPFLYLNLQFISSF